MQLVNIDLIRKLKTDSKSSVRKRAIKLFHNFDDKVQRMVQVLQPDTYAQPHMHKNPDKTEMFIVLNGKMAVVEFDDEGKIKQSVILNRKEGNYAADILPRTWHSIICLEKDTSMVEILEGPYEEMTHKKFASWAPKEGSVEAKEYLAKLKLSLKD